jgi:formate hydrogenlyase subunit 3/multisubunit Na+/H+ antiporter MnhD subunit
MQMATNDQRPRRKRVPINWGLPIFSAFLGLVLLAAGWIGGNPLLGLAMLGIMLAFGAIFVVGHRSETIRMMAAGRGADERWRSIDLRATAFSGMAVLAAVIVAFLWEIAHCRSGNPWAPLGALGGISYLAALLWLRWRR